MGTRTRAGLGTLGKGQCDGPTCDPAGTLAGPRCGKPSGAPPGVEPAGIPWRIVEGGRGLNLQGVEPSVARELQAYLVASFLAYALHSHASWQGRRRSRRCRPPNMDSAPD